MFGGLAAKFYRVADCEVGYKLSAGLDPSYVNAMAISPNGLYHSMFQIDYDLHDADPALLLADIRYAAQVAWGLSGYGAKYTPWPVCGFV